MKDNIKLSKILESIEFDYVINSDNTLSLQDQLGANLGNIESDKFLIDATLAPLVIDRIEIYINDYYVSDIVETLNSCHETASITDSYEELLVKMQKYLDKFKGSIEFIEAFVNAEHCDISDIIENLNIKEKCPRCNGRLYKSSKEDFAFYCPECDEDFYSFEVIGVVICTNELMSRTKQTNMWKNT